MTKILHTADIHLDAPLRSLALRDPELRDLVEAATRAAFAGIVETALAEGVAALLIAGDLFDGAQRSARSAAFLTAEFTRLAVAGIRVFYIKGNHDAENPLTGAIDLPDNVHVFDARGGKVALADDLWVHGVSFRDRHVPESLLPRFPDPVPGAVNIAMLHTSLAGAPGHDVYAPCTIGELAAMGFDYWALGHVHGRQVHAETPWIVMPGTPQGRDIGEAGPKSATLLHVDGGQIRIEAVPTSVAEFRQSILDVTGIDSDDALRHSLAAHLRAEAATVTSAAAILRLTLTGATPRHWQILRDRDVWQTQVQDMARAAGDMWLDKLILDLAAPASEASARGPNATAELDALMQTIRSEPGFAATAQTEVEALLADLPPALRARLWPDETAPTDLADHLSQQGAALVLARMKGAEG